MMPNNGLDTVDRFNYIDWSHDARLAYTVQGDIYLWDDNTTTNLIQNSDSSYGNVSWSKNGQLMFESRRDLVSNFFVWDGVSLKDGAPDVNTFIHVPFEQGPYPYWSNPTWTHDGFIGFTLYTGTPTNLTSQIVVWDTEKQEIIKQIPNLSGNLNRLSDGRQVVYSEGYPTGLPAYDLDVEDTEGQMLFSTVVDGYSWNSDGYLAYCKVDTRSEPSRTLSIWDGHESWTVTSDVRSSVQWQHLGRGFDC